MDELVTFSCPSCGANLEMEPGMQQITCQYCGSTHLLANLLSAKSLSGIQADAARARLMRYFDFSMKDLEYNRQGKLSPYQERRFSSQGVALFGILFAMGLGSTLMIFELAPFHQPILCSGISLIAFMIFGLINYLQSTKPIEVGVVETEVGTLGKPEHMNIWKPIIYIGRKAFPVKDDPFKALTWDVPYKVYYSPVRNIILSIELVEQQSSSVV